MPELPEQAAQPAASTPSDSTTESTTSTTANVCDIQSRCEELLNNGKRVNGKLFSNNQHLLDLVNETFPADLLEEYGILREPAGWESEVLICPLEGSGYETASGSSGRDHVHARDEGSPSTEEGGEVAFYAGGPSAKVAAALHSVASRESGSSTRVVFAEDGFTQSAARGSALYMHIRHSNALNADPLLQGHYLLARAFWRWIRPPTVEDAKHYAFTKVDLMARDIFSDWRTFLRVSGISVANEAHGLFNNFLCWLGKDELTDWAQNREFSSATPLVLRFLNRFSADPKDPLVISGQVDDSHPVHVCFTEHDEAEIETENDMLQRVSDVPSRRLNDEELEGMFDMKGMKQRGVHFAGWIYPDDGRVSPLWPRKLAEAIQATGNTCLHQHRVTRVFLDQDKVAGVELLDRATGRHRFVRCKSVVLSLGWRTTFRYQASNSGITRDNSSHEEEDRAHRVPGLQPQPAPSSHATSHLAASPAESAPDALAVAKSSVPTLPDFLPEKQAGLGSVSGVSLQAVMSKITAKLSEWRVPFCGPVEENCIATGFSGFAVVRRLGEEDAAEAIDGTNKSRFKLPIVGTRNSHWTELASANGLSLIKCTGGGIVATEEISPTYVINNISHLQALFGERYLGLVEAGTCSRAVNFQNDAHIARVWPGLYICTGQGGTGITKMGALGATYVGLADPQLRMPLQLPAAPASLFYDRTSRTALFTGLSGPSRLPSIASVYPGGVQDDNLRSGAGIVFGAACAVAVAAPLAFLLRRRGSAANATFRRPWKIF